MAEKRLVRAVSYMQASTSNSMIDAWLSCNGFAVFRTAHLVKDDMQPPSSGVWRASLMKVKVCVLQLGKLFNIASKKTEKPENSLSVFQKNQLQQQENQHLLCVFPLFHLIDPANLCQTFAQCAIEMSLEGEKECHFISKCHFASKHHWVGNEKWQ